ncbi:MAG: carboxypeptidase-like regulatory domain-containing protein, partial [Bacilli bacterium]
LDTIFFNNANAPFGSYVAKFYRSDGVVVDQRRFAYLPMYPEDCGISAEKGTYRAGDTATITTYIDPSLYEEYQFSAAVYNLNGEKVATWDTHNNKAYNLVLDADSYPAGTTLAYLVASPKAGGDAFEVAYTTFDIADTAYIHGTTYNAETGAPLANVTLNITQNANTHTLTTNATGQYNISTLIANADIAFSATLDSYRPANRSFFPTAAKTYPIDHYLLPANLSHTPNSTAVAGLVYSRPYNQAVESATVKITNSTWNTTTLATSTGFFLFDNLTPGEYSVSATKTGWKPSTTATVTAVEGNATPTEVQMSGIYSLTIEIRDATTHAYIPDATTVELQQDGTSISTQQTTSGKATFHNLDYGIYSALVSTEGYLTNMKNILVDTENATSTIYLTKQSDSSAGAGIQYPPHNVKFTLKTIWGAPIAGATVTAQGFETTAGAWEWLKSLLGIDTEETPLQNAEMTGTTDTNGEINFMMIESVKYHITIQNGDTTQEFDIYPKDDNYPITFATTDTWLPDGGDSLSSITVNVTTSTTGDVGHILVRYNDTTAKTTALTVQVTQQNATDRDTEDLIDTYTVTGQSVVSHTFDLTQYKGESYFVRLNATHPDFGTVERDYGVTFKGVRVPLGNLDDGLYIYVAAAILILLGCIFGATTAHMGAFIVCFAGWILWGFGWLDALGVLGPTALSFATVLSIVAVITKRYREEGYA